MTMKASIVIIGGGISGAAIAYNLAKKGMKDIIVVEKDFYQVVQPALAVLVLDNNGAQR